MTNLKKTALAILVPHMSAQDKDDNEDEGNMPPLEEVMSEFIDAVKSGDKAAAAKAFRAGMACSDDNEEEE